jgi:ABC-type transport system substrate-binding protein
MLQWSAIAGSGAVLAACGGAATPAAAPAATEAPKAEEPTAVPPTEAPAAEEPTAAPAAAGADVPRNRTFVVYWGGTGGKYTNVGIVNPLLAGYDHQSGGALLWEPLFYYSVFADKEIPWLAESGTYNADNTELTIKLRKGAEWSDGVPVTSKDVVFTLETVRTNPKVVYNADFSKDIKEITAPDDMTVIVTFNSPQPRLKFEKLSFKFDTGLPVVPAHAYEGVEDVATYQGSESMPHSGMFNIKMSPEQLIYDIRPDWWGFKTGFQKVPDMQRALFVPFTDQTNAAQRLVNNEVDSSLDLRNTTIRSVVDQNDKITTHTGKDEPLGYIDWWPNSLWMNTLLEPYSNKDVRWAMNHSIDRDTIDSVVYLGAKISTIVPFPLYPALVRYIDGALPIADKLGVRTFDLAKNEERMTAAGFTKDGEGFWVKDGARINATVNGFEGIHSDIVPVLVEMLRKGGFEAAINFGTDAGQNMSDGKPGLYMFGHGGSVIDPHATLDMYHSKYSVAVGQGGAAYYSRYKNPEWDAIADEMAALPIGDPKIPDLFNKAMEIFWTDMIDIPIIQWLHRIPYNQTYWTNYPTQDNPYLNGAFWHWTFPLMALALKAAQ